MDALQTDHFPHHAEADGARDGNGGAIEENEDGVLAAARL